MMAGRHRFVCTILRVIIMSSEDAILEVYKSGELTVVGFGGREILDQVDVNDCREEITNLVKQHNCQTFAVDLTGVKLMPSGLLGLFASIRELGVEVQIYNPSDDIREVLEVTKLDQIMPVRDVEL